jgi:copper-binding protein NosD
MFRRAALVLALFFLPLIGFAQTQQPSYQIQNGVRTTDVYNVLFNGLQGDCSTKDNTALASLLTKVSAVTPANARAKIYFPVPPGGCYAFGASVAIPSNLDLDPAGGVVLKQTSVASPTGNGAFFTMTSVSNIRIGQFILDQQNSIHTSISQAINITGSNDITLDHIKIVNPSGSIVAATSYNLHILFPDVQNGLFHGVLFNGGVHDSEVLNGNFQSNVGFGIILAGVNYRNLLQGNHTIANGIELIGVTFGSYQNVITGNHAEGTGDNCISITGHENTVSNNEAIGCAGNGIHIYGDRNTVVGNYAKNNSQSFGTNAAWRAGIAIEQGFGGMGQNNIVTGNVTDDDQVSPTQQYGVWLAAGTYTTWLTGTPYASGVYRFSGLNLYVSTNAATSGASAPTCTSGTCSDGAVTWSFVSTFAAGDTLNDHNIIIGNNNVHSAIQSFLDASGGTANEIIGGYNGIPLPSALQAASIGNAGSVSTITPVVKGSYVNGTSLTLTVANSPTNSRATATPVFTILGFGSLATAGSGCSVNDVLTVTGGTFAASGDAIKVLTVDGGGAVLTFTGFRFDNYTVLPPTGNTAVTGGTCSVQPTLTGTVWQVNAVTVTAGGGGYTVAPTVTPSSGTATFTVALSSTFTITGGAGTILMDSTGINLSGPVTQTGGATSITGSATNDSAGAGLVGQIITSSVPVGSASSLTSAAAGANITSISLTAGDWDVDAVVGFHPAASTSVTVSSAGITTTSATIPLLSTGASDIRAQAAQVPAVDYSLVVPPTRISLSATTTVFMTASSTFSVSTNAGYGFIRARRVR